MYMYNVCLLSEVQSILAMIRMIVAACGFFPYTPISACMCWAPCSTAAVDLCSFFCTKTQENHVPFHSLWKQLHNFLDRTS